MVASRAAAAIDEMLNSKNTLNSRLQIGENKLSESKEPEWVEMKMIIEITDTVTTPPETTISASS
ncbi:MAG: hypothetical protein P8R04_03710 [Gammaproteobacteria bacterium]|nr:hypothetical protein [Gammaproteobacteria bacterium]